MVSPVGARSASPPAKPQGCLGADPRGRRRLAVLGALGAALLLQGCGGGAGDQSNGGMVPKQGTITKWKLDGDPPDADIPDDPSVVPDIPIAEEEVALKRCEKDAQSSVVVVCYNAKSTGLSGRAQHPLFIAVQDRGKCDNGETDACALDSTKQQKIWEDVLEGEKPQDEPRLIQDNAKIYMAAAWTVCPRLLENLAKATETKCPLVVSLGGDGTILGVAKLAMGAMRTKGMRMTIIAAGTGNDAAKSLGSEVKLFDTAEKTLTKAVTEWRKLTSIEMTAWETTFKAKQVLFPGSKAAGDSKCKLTAGQLACSNLKGDAPDVLEEGRSRFSMQPAARTPEESTSDVIQLRVPLFLYASIGYRGAKIGFCAERKRRETLATDGKLGIFNMNPLYVRCAQKVLSDKTEQDRRLRKVVIRQPKGGEKPAWEEARTDLEDTNWKNDLHLQFSATFMGGGRFKPHAATGTSATLAMLSKRAYPLIGSFSRIPWLASDVGVTNLLPDKDGKPSQVHLPFTVLFGEEPAGGSQQGALPGKGHRNYMQVDGEMFGFEELAEVHFEPMNKDASTVPPITFLVSQAKKEEIDHGRKNVLKAIDN